MAKLYLYSKQVHRWSMFIVIILTLLMGWTGMLMKYPLTASWFMVDLAFVRFLHNQLSPIFSISLFIMIITGLNLYLLPELIKRKANRQTQQLSNQATQPERT